MNYFLIILISFVLLFSKCHIISAPNIVDNQDYNDQSLSIVFGHFDMKDAPSKIDYAKAQHYIPKPEGIYNCRVLKDKQTFFHHGIRLGSMQVVEFGAYESGVLFKPAAIYTYNFGYRGRNQTARRIKKPGVYFLGSYKYVAGKKIDNHQFDYKIINTEAPKEKEILKKLLKEYYLKNEKSKKKFIRQIKMIQKRLQEIE